MKPRLIASLGVAFATGIGLLQSQNVNAETPDHYGVYLESKTEQTEIVDMTEGEEVMEYFSTHPVSTSDSDAHLLVYHPDIKPTQVKLYKLVGGDRNVVPTIVKPLERDQYSVKPRAPLEKGLYSAVYEEYEWIFAIGDKAEIESVAALFKKGNEGALEAARAESQAKGCVNNLRIMDAAKEQAAMELGWTTGLALGDGTDPEKEFLMYIKHSVKPQCPSGGSYTWNAIGAVPTCSVPGHSL